MNELLSQPNPIIFTVCQGVQQLTNGAFNLLGVYDKMLVSQLPDGTLPDSVTLQVVVVWTGGQGKFEQILRVLDQDAQQIGEVRAKFELASTSARHYAIALLGMPIKEGILTLTVARGDGEELLREDFTIEVVPFPGSPQ